MQSQNEVQSKVISISVMFNVNVHLYCNCVRCEIMWGFLCVFLFVWLVLVSGYFCFYHRSALSPQAGTWVAGVSEQKVALCCYRSPSCEIHSTDPGQQVSSGPCSFFSLFHSCFFWSQLCHSMHSLITTVHPWSAGYPLPCPGLPSWDGPNRRARGRLWETYCSRTSVP